VAQAGREVRHVKPAFQAARSLATVRTPCTGFTATAASHDGGSAGVRLESPDLHSGVTRRIGSRMSTQEDRGVRAFSLLE
jgi:hypothetical protein